jgi:uncharacterized protein involved in tellurium resistance
MVKGSQRIKQALFTSKNGAGETLTFVILEDDRCAITKNQETIAVGGPDSQSIDQLVLTFLKQGNRKRERAASVVRRAARKA